MWTYRISVMAILALLITIAAAGCTSTGTASAGVYYPAYPAYDYYPAGYYYANDYYGPYYYGYDPGPEAWIGGSFHHEGYEHHGGFERGGGFAHGGAMAHGSGSSHHR
jgi:hypothetical protein